MSKRIGKLYLSSFVGLSLLLGALPASAAEVLGQHVNNVGYNADAGSNGELGVYLATGSYHAVSGTSPGCNISAPSPDTVRTWIGFAQTALLSGKTVSIGYSDCGGRHYIVWLNLNLNA